MNVNLIYRLPGIGTALTDFTKDAEGSTHWIGPTIIRGTVTDVVGFTKAADGSLHWTLAGREGAGGLREGDGRRRLPAPVRRGREIAPCRRHGQGSSPALSARTQGDLKPQFDYAAEVKAAKEAWPALRDKLGLVPPPGKGDPAKTESAAPKQP